MQKGNIATKCCLQMIRKSNTISSATLTPCPTTPKIPQLDFQISTRQYKGLQTKKISGSAPLLFAE